MLVVGRGDEHGIDGRFITLELTETQVRRPSKRSGGFTEGGEDLQIKISRNMDRETNDQMPSALVGTLSAFSSYQLETMHVF